MGASCPPRAHRPGQLLDVFRAWDSELHRDVALKLFHVDEAGSAAGEAQARVMEEARRLARLRHEHVVQVYGAEEHDGRVGLWTELVRGESLEQLLTERGQLGAREAALIGLDVCAALAAVHGAGLLHRDVKAQNVMREAGGRVVLMDLGTGEPLSGTSRLVGTPLYLAPEIFRGQKASVQSDLYSLGVMLFYLVSGKFPVAAATMEQLRRAHAIVTVSRSVICGPTCPKASCVWSNGLWTRIRSGGIEAPASWNTVARIAGPASYRPSARRGTGRDRETASSSQDAVPGGCDAARSAGGGAHRLDAALDVRGHSGVGHACGRAAVQGYVEPTCRTLPRRRATDQLISSLGRIGSLPGAVVDVCDAVPRSVDLDDSDREAAARG